MPVAYSYLRFSSPQQASGDSVRRQTEATTSWCQRHGIALDESLNLRDEGVSAFKGKNREDPDVHGLAVFLTAIKTGRVPSGSYLVVENLDRLTRENIVPAVNLFTGILLAGVKIVQLQPVEQTFDAAADMTAVMLALVELSRGNSESRMKSERVGAAWRNKKANAANKVLTKMTPGWIKWQDGKLVLDEKKAVTVRRAFMLAREGKGIGKIAKILNAEKAPVLGRTSHRGRPLIWSTMVVYKLLTNRATYGTYQPHVGSRGPERRPVGDPVQGYYPSVISEEEYHIVRGLLATRAKVGKGRRGKHVNLFAGLLKDARTGGSLTYKHGARGAVLLPVESRTNMESLWVTFKAKPFEESILTALSEVKVSDIAPESGSAAARVEAMRGQLADVESLTAKWRSKMDDPNTVDVVSAKLSELAAKGKAIAAELAEAQREASSPFAESWGAARAAGKGLEDDNSDEARERYRAALRRTVENIWVLLMPAKDASIRIAAVQIWFTTGAHRDYLIGYKPGRGKQQSEAIEPQSFAAAGLPDIDLRDPEQAKRYALALESIPPMKDNPLD